MHIAPLTDVIGAYDDEVDGHSNRPESFAQTHKLRTTTSQLRFDHEQIKVTPGRPWAAGMGAEEDHPGIGRGFGKTSPCLSDQGLVNSHSHSPMIVAARCGGSARRRSGSPERAALGSDGAESRDVPHPRRASEPMNIKPKTPEQAEMLYGNRFLTEDAPDGPFRQRHVVAGRDAAGRRGAGPGGRPAAQPGDLRHHLDGARGAADHRREPLPELHRPRRVPDLGRGRAALHPHARRPLPCPGRDDRRPHQAPRRRSCSARSP